MNHKGYFFNKMKIVICILISIMTLGLASLCLAAENKPFSSYPNEPDGFRNIKWGMSINKVKQYCQDKGYELLFQSTKKYSSTYQYSDGFQKISGEYIVLPIVFYFDENDKFGEAELSLGEGDNKTLIDKYDRLKSKLTELFGSPTSINESVDIDLGGGIFTCKWKGPKTTIFLMMLYDKNDNSIPPDKLVISIASTNYKNKVMERLDRIFNDNLKKAQGW